MNPSELKPYLEKLTSEFPHEQCEVGVKIEPDSEVNEFKYFWRVHVGYYLYFGATFDEAIAAAKAEYNPDKIKRREAAKVLRLQADRIEKGEEPIQ